MAQIEAFLRTGEGPPAAPEPRPVRSLPPEGAEPPADPFLAPGGPAPGGGGRWRRLNPFRHGLPTGGPVRYRRPGWSARRAHPAGLPPEPPRWTLARALVVASVLVALLLLPALYPSRSSSSGSGGSDRASAAPAGPGYSFLARNRSGTPVRWNPCSPVNYVTNLGAAPAWAAADVQAAVARIGQATGILFVDKGTTTTFPSGGGYVSPDGQSGPVVIAWASPDQNGAIPFPAGATGADSLGRTEPIAAENQSHDHGVYVTGSVLIGSSAGQLPEGFGPGGLGVLLLHQLGHLMGLADVVAPGQVMSAGVLSSPVMGLGSGDLAGLKRLGTASGCLQVPATSVLQPA